jgi:hypothetical protein
VHFVYRHTPLPIAEVKRSFAPKIFAFIFDKSKVVTIVKQLHTDCLAIC